MPLDGHSYLVSQGWGGKGTGLRHGAIIRPLAIPQKKTLAGLGKDRDEAFPFWDHLFSAASKSIQIKCLSDDEEEENELSTNSTNNTTSIKYTSTGILSNRRPIDGTPATSSGTNTPENDTAAAAPSHHRLGLLATAKRDAAKRGLYSKFFRGPVLGPDTLIEDEKRLAALVSQTFLANESVVSLQETVGIQSTDRKVRVDLEVSESLENHAKRRKTGPRRQEESEGDGEKERKRRKQRKETEKHSDKPEDTEANNNSCTLGKSSPALISQKDQKEKNRFSGNAIDDHERQADRKRRKEEKKRLKKLERDYSDKTHYNSENLTKPEDIGSTITVPELLDELKKQKKKRKHADTEHESQADRKRRKEEKKRLKNLEKDTVDDGTRSNSGKQTKLGEIGSAITAPELLNDPKKRKKKRKHADVE